MASRQPAAGGHPIKVVVRRAGISADVLRAWEKRYGAVTPTRSDTGRRLYSDADIERLRLIKEAIAGGRRIGDVATLPGAELERLVEQDRLGAKAEPPASAAPMPVQDLLGDALAAVVRADQAGLRSVLARALLALAPTRFISDLATPFMHRIGDLWERGELTPGHEHIATEVMRQLLSEVLDMLRPVAHEPLLLVTTPSGQRHEIGALLAATTTAIEGWRVTYLGSDLPAGDIGRIAREAVATAVALSVTVEDAEIPGYMAALRAALGGGVPILVGGQRAATAHGAAERLVTLRDLESFRVVLRSLSGTG